VAKTDLERVKTILYTALQLCGSLAVACEPFMPFMAKRLADDLRLTDIKWDMIGSDTIVPSGTNIAPAELLFEKIDDEAIAAQTDRLARIKEENKLKNWHPAEQQPDVDFDTFCRSDIRVATVTDCVKVPKADKLLQFTLDDGTGTPRTIVSGIAAHYPEPEKLIGTQVCFIANLPARKLRGITSQGMILSAENSDGKLVLMAPSAPVAAGAQVK
jgi:methionyl-tRNA synthetase